MELVSFDTEALIVAGNACEHEFKTRLGYQDATFRYILIGNTVRLEFHLHDDFQNNLDYEERCHHGWGVQLEVTATSPVLEVYNKLRVWPTREQRELHVMAGQLAKVGQSCNDMVTKQVQAFVNQIKAQQSDIAMLVHKT